MAKPVSRTRAPRAESPEEITGLRAVTHGGRTIYVAEDADPSLLDEDAMRGGDDAMSAALSGVLTELGARDDDAKVSVYKIENANGVRKEAFLYECHPTGFSLGDLQESYGAGDYRVKVYGQQAGTNYKIIHANPRITIGPTREQAKKSALPVALAASAPVADAGIATALGLLAQAVAKLGTNAGSSRADMLAELKTMAEIAGMNRPQSGGELAGLQGALGLMTALKGVMGGTDKIDDADAAPYQLMGKALETFSEIYRTTKGGAQPAAVDTPALAAPVAPPAGPGQPAPENDAVNIMLKGQLMTLLFAARANDNPEKWAVRIYEDAPDAILDAIEAPDWFEQVCTLEAGFSGVRPWLEKVRAVVLEEIAAAQTGLTEGAQPDTKGASIPGAPNAAAGPGPDKPA